MENRNLILLLVEKSTNAFGRLIGLTADAKLRITLTIIQNTIQESFNINSNYLSKKILEDTLSKDQLDTDQTKLLTSLLWLQAEILLKLKKPQESLGQYENALQLLNWQTQQTIKKSNSDIKNKMDELNLIIAVLKPKAKLNSILEPIS